MYVKNGVRMAWLLKHFLGWSFNFQQQYPFNIFARSDEEEDQLKKMNAPQNGIRTQTFLEEYIVFQTLSPLEQNQREFWNKK